MDTTSTSGRSPLSVPACGYEIIGSTAIITRIGDWLRQNHTSIARLMRFPSTSGALPHQGEDCRWRRFTLRIDGFVSVQAPLNGGELLTKPLVFKGDYLVLNLSTSAVGSIQVEIQDESGVPIPGFGLDECPDVFGDALERTVSWKNGADVSPLLGRPIRLKIYVKGCKPLFNSVLLMSRIWRKSGFHQP